MSLGWRPMEPEDVAECAEIIAAHPVIGPRYGSAIKDLGRAWHRLLGSEAMTTAVFEEVDRGRAHLAGVGVGVFVRDEFIREMKTPRQFWVGPELTKRILNGNSPVLSDKEVREANSGEGLNELVWETITGPSYAKRTEIYHLMGSAYIEIHRGFRLKEMITSQRARSACSGPSMPVGFTGILKLGATLSHSRKEPTILPETLMLSASRVNSSSAGPAPGSARLRHLQPNRHKPGSGPETRRFPHHRKKDMALRLQSRRRASAGIDCRGFQGRPQQQTRQGKKAPSPLVSSGAP
jgi:hypothetical protein